MGHKKWGMTWRVWDYVQSVFAVPFAFIPTCLLRGRLRLSFSSVFLTQSVLPPEHSLGGYQTTTQTYRHDDDDDDDGRIAS